MKAILRFDNVDLYRELAFTDKDVVTIGREKDNAVPLELGVLSRHHARVFAQGGSWFVEDLDSANGSFHCGKQLKPNAKEELANGDIVRFGTVAMSISFADDAVSAAAPAAAVEKVVEKRVEVPVAKLMNIPREINGKPVPEFSPEDPSKPFRPGLAIPADLKVASEARTIRL